MKNQSSTAIVIEILMGAYFAYQGIRLVKDPYLSTMGIIETVLGVVLIGLAVCSIIMKCKKDKEE